MVRAKSKRITLEDALISVDEQPYEIPENWCWIYQNVVCQLGNGEKRSNAEYPYLEVKYLRGNSEAKFKSEGKYIDAHTKVILVDGENSGEVFEVLEHGYMGSTFKTLNICSGVNEKYLLFFVDSNKDLLRNNKTGSAIPHLNKKLFFSLAFPLPPLEEQQRIVEQIENLFAKLDEAKEKAREALDGFELRRASILSNAMQGKYTKSWRKKNKIEKTSWKQTKFKDFCFLKRGFDLPTSQRREGIYPLVTSGGINDYVAEAKVQGPGVVTGRSGTIGKVYLIEDNYWPLNTTLYSEKLYSNDAEYVYYYLQTFNFKEYSSSTAVPTLNRNLFADEIILVPSVEEQKQIVACIKKLLESEEQIIYNIENVLNNIELMKKSILEKAFRGELGTNNLEEESSIELLKQILS